MTDRVDDGGPSAAHEARSATASGRTSAQSGDQDPDQSRGLLRRTWERLRSIEPMYLGMLGLLSFLDGLHEALAFTQLFALFFLAFLWPFVAPLVGLLRPDGDENDDEDGHPRDWLRDDEGTREHLTFLAMLPLTFLNPLLMVKDVWQAIGGAVAAARHGGSVPDAERYEQAVEYRLPFEGTWTAVNGSPVREHSHSWFYVNQRYAYDFVKTDETGRSRPEGSPARVEEYYCYGEPILAPAAGTVVDTYDASPESDRAGGFSHPLKGSIRGNYVVIQHAREEYSSLVHLQPGSVTVEAGDRVERGQQVGRCGHSGNSSEPHIHFQVQDHPDWILAASLPVRFDDVEIEWPGDPATAPDLPAGHEDLPAFTEEGSHERAFVSVGQRVTPGPFADEEASGDQGRGGENVERRAEGSPVPSEVADRSSEPVRAVSGSSPATRGRGALRNVREGSAHAGLGLGIGGALAFFGALVATSKMIAGLLLAGTVLALGYALRSIVSAGGNRRAAARYVGTAAGVATAATLVAPSGPAPSIGVGLRTLGPVLLGVGFAIYVVLGEYDRWRLAGDRSEASA